jgi:hypothetical protein
MPRNALTGPTVNNEKRNDQKRADAEPQIRVDEKKFPVTLTTDPTDEAASGL